MNQENKASRPGSQELTQSEVALSELNTRIWTAHKFLIGTLFRDDTWNIRQGWTYGFPILEVEDDGKDHDWEKEGRVVTRIVEELGDRLGYYEAAYYFPDRLSACGHMTNTKWVEMKARRDVTKSKYEITEGLLRQAVEMIEQETEKFEDFLDSDEFKSAFTVKVEKTTGKYQIIDLALDANELRDQWREWFGLGESEAR